MIFILISFFTCLSIHISLEIPPKKISERPLKRKLISNTLNLLFFLVILWCQLAYTKEYIKIISILLISILIIVIFIYSNLLKTNILLIYNTFKFKTSYSVATKKQIDELERKLLNNKKSTKKDIYIEYILLSFILFCKRMILCVSILFTPLYYCITYNIIDLKKLFNDSQISFPNEFLINSLIILNNIGLIFCIWKFKKDFSTIEYYLDKSDSGLNSYLDNIIKRLKRYEHDI